MFIIISSGNMQKSPKESFLCFCRMGVEAMNEFPPGLTFKGCLTKKLLVDIARRDLLYLRLFGSVMTKSANKVAMNLPSWKICKIFFFLFFSSRSLSCIRRLFSFLEPKQWWSKTISWNPYKYMIFAAHSFDYLECL